MKPEHLATIIKLNNIIGFLPIGLDEILQVVVQETKKLFPDHCVCLYLDEGERFHVGAGDCSCRTGSHCAREERICPAVLDGLPVVVSDAGQGCDPDPAASYACIPIKSGSVVLGILSVTGRETEPFSRESLEVILSLANQAGLAIQRARLYDNLAREKQELLKANREISQLNLRLSEKIKELKSYQEQLVLSAKLAATGQMAADLAHEINNPVSIILGRLECLFWEIEERGATPDSLVDDLKTIFKHSRRIAETTRGLLSFARKSPAPFEELALDQVVAETIALLGRQFATQGVGITVDATCPLPPVLGSRQKLQQVLVNLLTNARDAMPGGGSIAISVRPAGPDQVAIEVVDTGGGISAEVINNIFDPFFTTKDVGKGTGLGLSISYGIIKEHGGTIEVASRDGKGTAFVVRLPVAQKPEGGCFG